MNLLDLALKCSTTASEGTPKDLASHALATNCQTGKILTQPFSQRAPGCRSLSLLGVFHLLIRDGGRSESSTVAETSAAGAFLCNSLPMSSSSFASVLGENFRSRHSLSRSWRRSKNRMGAFIMRCEGRYAHRFGAVTCRACPPHLQCFL